MLNYIVTWSGLRMSDKYRQCIERTRSVVESAGHLLELRILPVTANADQAAVEKDLYVLKIMTCEDNIAVIDADIQIEQIFLPPADSRPYASYEGGCPIKIFNDVMSIEYEGGSPRISYMIPNGCKQFFIDCLSLKERKKYPDADGAYQKLFRKADIGRIPDNTYVHHRLRSS